MRTIILTILLVVGISFTSGCSEFDSDYNRSRDNTPAARRDKIEQIFPDEAEFTQWQLAALIEAIRTVRPDIPQSELPLVGKAVRNVLNQMSLRELNRVQTILPGIIKKRRDEGVGVD